MLDVAEEDRAKDGGPVSTPGGRAVDVSRVVGARRTVVTRRRLLPSYTAAAGTRNA